MTQAEIEELRLLNERLAEMSPLTIMIGPQVAYLILYCARTCASLPGWRFPALTGDLIEQLQEGMRRAGWPPDLVLSMKGAGQWPTD
jgi:hypothetical protein